MEKIRHRSLEILLGLGLAAAMILTVFVIWESFRGAFGDKMQVSAHLSQAGDALEQGDIVTYRNVIVGEVSSSSGNVDGSAVASLSLDPGQGKVIPAGSTAVAVPASLFGATKIEILPPANLSGPKLHNGSVIAADTNPAAESLQTALANAYRLLTAIHPAQLDAALSSLATALDGQGKNINTLILKADNYLRAIAPAMPEIDDTITSLATVTDEIARNAPSLLSSLRNLLVVSKGIQDSKQAVANLLDVAPTALDNAQLLLSPRNNDNAVTIFRDQAPVSAALAANPTALTRTIQGFKAFGDAFADAVSGGKLHVNLILTGISADEIVPALANLPGHAADGITNPPEYTSADCPRYDGADGPICGSAAGTSGASAAMITTGFDWGGSSDSVGSKQEVFAVRNAAHSLTHLPLSEIPDATDLLLGPMLRGAATVIR